jgi:hypothetical protein
MRRGVFLFVICNFAIVTYLVYSVWTLLTLLVVDGSDDAIPRAEIPGPNSDDPFNGRPQLIPKIIHQTYANASLPPHWQEAQKSCRDLHVDYEYKVCFVCPCLSQLADPPSSGPTSRPASSSPPSTRGSSRRSTATNSPSNAPTRFATSSLPTMAASTSTSTTYVVHPSFLPL